MQGEKAYNELLKQIEDAIKRSQETTFFVNTKLQVVFSESFRVLCGIEKSIKDISLELLCQRYIDATLKVTRDFNHYLKDMASCRLAYSFGGEIKHNKAVFTDFLEPENKGLERDRKYLFYRCERISFDAKVLGVRVTFKIKTYGSLTALCPGITGSSFRNLSLTAINRVSEKVALLKLCCPICQQEVNRIFYKGVNCVEEVLSCSHQGARLDVQESLLRTGNTPHKKGAIQPIIKFSVCTECKLNSVNTATNLCFNCGASVCSECGYTPKNKEWEFCGNCGTKLNLHQNAQPSTEIDSLSPSQKLEKELEAVKNIAIQTELDIPTQPINLETSDKRTLKESLLLEDIPKEPIQEEFTSTQQLNAYRLMAEKVKRAEEEVERTKNELEKTKAGFEKSQKEIENLVASTSDIATLYQIWKLNINNNAAVREQLKKLYPIPKDATPWFYVRTQKKGNATYQYLQIQWSQTIGKDVSGKPITDAGEIQLGNLTQFEKNTSKQAAR